MIRHWSLVGHFAFTAMLTVSVLGVFVTATMLAR